jgi:phage shock protein E
MMRFREFAGLPVAIALALIFTLTGAHAADNPAAGPGGTTIKFVNAEQAQKLMAARNMVVLDLRTPGEFKAGCISGATNLNFFAPDFEKQLAALDKNQTYLVHCASGNRSSQALPIFKKLKFQSIYHLDGGLKGWEKAGLPVKK